MMNNQDRIRQWSLRDTSSLLAVLMLAAAVMACGSNDPPSVDDAAAAPAASSPSPVETSSNASHSVEGIDVCARIPMAEVAKVLDTDPEQISGKSTSGTYASDCTYSFRRANDTQGYAILFVYPPELWSTDLDGAKPVAGLGDAAVFEQTEAFAKLRVLDGSRFIDARADTAEQSRALAELALEHLD